MVKPVVFPLVVVLLFVSSFSSKDWSVSFDYSINRVFIRHGDDRCDITRFMTHRPGAETEMKVLYALKDTNAAYAVVSVLYPSSYTYKEDVSCSKGSEHYFLFFKMTTNLKLIKSDSLRIGSCHDDISTAAFVNNNDSLYIEVAGPVMKRVFFDKKNPSRWLAKR